MVAVNLPSPRFAGRRLTQDAYPVQPFAVLFVPTRHFAHGIVELHHVPDRRKTLRAQRSLENCEGSLPLLQTHLVEHDAVA